MVEPVTAASALVIARPTRPRGIAAANAVTAARMVRLLGTGDSRGMCRDTRGGELGLRRWWGWRESALRISLAISPVNVSPSSPGFLARACGHHPAGGASEG